MKLHLGCGAKRIDGYINVDSRPTDAVDIIADARVLEDFEEDSADVIYVCHVLEHFSRWEHMGALKRWYDILKPGGILRIAVPDFEKVVEHYLKFGEARKLSGIMYGRQDYPENNHCWCWDFRELTKDLQEVGFSNIERYDWKKTDHSHIDDYSQAYLPHMDKENGMLMSLNVEGIKL
jgi:predicted SAM-dependent methyltransferase